MQMYMILYNLNFSSVFEYPGWNTIDVIGVKYDFIILTLLVLFKLLSVLKAM